LWRHVDRAEEWTLYWPSPSPRSQPLPDHLDEFVARKRRALFEHKEGAALISGGDRVDRELRKLMRPGAKAVRRLIGLLNRFFDREESSDSVLHLWMTHRYNAYPSRYAAAAAEVHHGKLELLLPTLRSGLDEAFPDYKPDHAILCEKAGEPSQGLRVDRPLVAALLAAERGLPAGFQRGEPEARIASFINRLAKPFGDLSEQDELLVRIVDRNGGGRTMIAVDVPGKRYVQR
jgi:hypothetical protein